MQNIKRFDDKPYMTIGIIVVNIIVFVLMSLSGSTLDAQYMAAHGAMYPEYIKDGQYLSLIHIWRIQGFLKKAGTLCHTDKLMAAGLSV